MGPPAHRQKSAKNSKEQQKRRRGSPASKPGKGDPEAITGGGTVKLEPAVADYFHQAHETFKSGFASDEEKSLFVSNVLTEATGAAVPLALDPSGSLFLQALLPSASGASLEPLFRALLPSLRLVACHPCGAHILEGALWRVPLLISEGGEEARALEELVLDLGKSLREELTTFALDAHASFVVRTLLQVLGGARVGSDGGRGLPGSGPFPSWAKSSKVGREGPAVFEVPISFLSLLREFKDCFQEQIPDLITNKYFSLCLQVALEILHRKLPEECAELCQALIGYLSSCNPAAEQSNLLVFLKDATCSRVLDKVLEVSGVKALRSFYKAHVKGQLRVLAAHKVANFTLQRLIQAASRKLLGQLFQELGPGLEEILALEHLGIITALLGACRKRGVHQPEVLQLLLEAFHCWELPARRLACAPLLASVLAYEVYYGEEEEEEKEQEDATPPALSTVSYHGSLMLQHLLHFADPSLVLGSLAAMPPADLVTLACDPSGSHVFDALLASPSVSEKARRKVLRQLKGHFLPLACSKHGSRVLDAIWGRASLPGRRELAQELAAHEPQLRYDPFGHHLVRNFALTHFLKRRRDWDSHQQAEKKRRDLFAEILED
ncbi:nucleolar protein 9 [Ahaetulla prasina]|uniref:nucleolar protein 9 n=1 Tax=Ahaetulla prasina TaxID=499056 RepID=UPI00264A06D6|nr:nucleolar protein 9 [Ahaetulla prasina]